MAGAAQEDYPVHVSDYRSFVRGVQIIVAGLAVLLLLMAHFLL